MLSYYSIEELLSAAEDAGKKLSLIHIYVTLYEGSGGDTAYGCDLTYDYVKINGDYRT